MSIRFKGKTRYNPDWEDPRLHPQLSQWIQSVNTDSSDDVFYFQCKVCKGGKIFLSNMGIATAKKHMTDPKPDKKCKHNKRMEDLRSMKRDQVMSHLHHQYLVVRQFYNQVINHLPNQN